MGEHEYARGLPDSASQRMVCRTTTLVGATGYAQFSPSHYWSSLGTSADGSTIIAGTFESGTQDGFAVIRDGSMKVLQYDATKPRPAMPAGGLAAEFAKPSRALSASGTGGATLQLPVAGLQVVIPAEVGGESYDHSDVLKRTKPAYPSRTADPGSISLCHENGGQSRLVVVNLFDGPGQRETEAATIRALLGSLAASPPGQ